MITEDDFVAAADKCGEVITTLVWFCLLKDRTSSITDPLGFVTLRRRLLKCGCFLWYEELAKYISLAGAKS
jgi:hypothetical protein